MISRTELLEKAAEVFREKGYRSTSISDITNNAGIAVGSFYKFFNSKEDIFLKVYVEENNRLKENIIDSIDKDLSVIEFISMLQTCVMEVTKNNMIIKEWNLPYISERLKAYYNSEEGRNSYSFHLSLREYIREKIKGTDEVMTEKVMKIYDFMYRIDCTMPADEEYAESFTLITEYILKGLVSEIRNSDQ